MQEYVKLGIGGLIIITAILISLLVLKQDAKGGGMGTLGGGPGAATDTYWGKNKSKSKERKLALYTKALIFAFLAEILSLSIIP